MLLGKVGNKSIAFINHKPFHPGNLQNLEKVWLAEQKAFEEENKQKEMLERRRHEIQIEELRKLLRERESQKYNVLTNALSASTEERIIIPSIKRNPSSKRKKKRKMRNRKVDDLANVANKKIIFEKAGIHKEIWGSFYDIYSKRWGFKCCKSTVYNSSCLK